MTDVKPFDLRLAGNEIHLNAMALGKISEQAAQRFQNHTCHILNSDAIITPEITLEHDLLHASSDEDNYRNWIIVNDDINDLSIVRVSRCLASSLTDLACGGTGTTINRDTKERPHTSEGRVLNIIVNHLLEELMVAFSALAPATLRLANDRESTLAEHRQSYKPDFLSCMNFHLKASKARGTFSILYPTSQLKTDTHWYSQTDKLTALKERMLDISLPVNVVLTRHQTTLNDMLALEVGDIIPIGDTTDAEFQVAGKCIGTGKVMTDDTRLLIEVASLSE